jgi:hypothetical protein
MHPILPGLPSQSAGGNFDYRAVALSTGITASGGGPGSDW